MSPLGGLQERSRWLLLVLVAALLAAMALFLSWTGAGAASAPDWLEPRGLSVLELVGQVPDAYLQGMIISNAEPTGIVVYESGRRRGHTVVVTTTIYPRVSAPWWARNQLLTEFGCLSEMPRFDHVGSVVPTTTLRVYDSAGTEVTSQIESMVLSRMDSQQPLADSTQYVRYPEEAYGPYRSFPLPLGLDGLSIPSNSGCRIQIPGVDYPQLLGVFTLDFAPTVRVSVLGSQEARFRSYIGEGSFGIFQPLMDQLRLRFGDRHRRIALSAPRGSNYILVRFPTTPADPYADPVGGLPYLNAERPTGGTYRLARDTVELSADLSFSAAFPLKVAWQDSDQIPKRMFLAVIDAPNQLAPPEYVLPTGIRYDDCYTQGNCPDQILQQIYESRMTLEIFYLSVTRVAKEGGWVPLKMAGKTWSASAEYSATTNRGEATAGFTVEQGTPWTMYLPLVIREVNEVLPDGCPCGWFDSLGRMLDYAP